MATLTLLASEPSVVELSHSEDVATSNVSPSVDVASLEVTDDVSSSRRSDEMKCSALMKPDPDDDELSSSNKSTSGAAIAYPVKLPPTGSIIDSLVSFVVVISTSVINICAAFTDPILASVDVSDLLGYIFALNE